MDTSLVINDHSELKLNILKYYLAALIKITSTFAKDIKIIDAFCGRGQDINGKDGSAKIIIDLLDSMSKDVGLSQTQLSAFFNDIEVDHTANIGRFVESLNNSKLFISFANKDGESFLEAINQKSSRNDFKFLFYDPYNYAPIKKRLISDFLQKNYSEALIFVPFTQIYRFVNGVKNNAYEEDHVLSIFLKDLFGDDLTKIDNSSELIFFREIANSFQISGMNCSQLLIQEGKGKYGLLFFSRSIRGNALFVDACYKKFDLKSDLITTYDIDTHIPLLKIRSSDETGQTSFFGTDAIVEDFEISDERLFSKLKGNKIKSSELYKYLIERNVLPKQVQTLLGRMEKTKKIIVERPPKSKGFHLVEKPEKLIQIAFLE